MNQHSSATTTETNTKACLRACSTDTPKHVAGHEGVCDAQVLV